jgi:hypothetical protein
MPAVWRSPPRMRLTGPRRQPAPRHADSNHARFAERPPTENGHLAGSGAQIWPWLDGSMRCREGQRPSAVWNGWQTNHVRPGGMTGRVALDPSPARRSWHETLSAWLSCGIVVSKQRRCEVTLSLCDTSTNRAEASTRPRLRRKFTAPFRQSP